MRAPAAPGAVVRVGGAFLLHNATWRHDAVSAPETLPDLQAQALPYSALLCWRLCLSHACSSFETLAAVLRNTPSTITTQSRICSLPNIRI